MAQAEYESRKEKPNGVTDCIHYLMNRLKEQEEKERRYTEKISELSRENQSLRRELEKRDAAIREQRDMITKVAHSDAAEGAQPFPHT